MPELQTFTPSELAIYHRNPNLGNIAGIEASLRAHGQYKPVVVNRGTHTGRPLEVLAGNHTLKAFRNLQEAEPEVAAWREVIGYVIDVDDDRAARIVLVDNKTAEDGFGYDTEILADILGGFDGDFTGTAFTEDEYSDLLAGLEEAMPDFGEAGGKPPRTGPDGLIASTDLETQAETYVDASTRLVVLTLAVPQFIWANDQLAAYRKEFGLETTTDAVVHLLENWSGEAAPVVEPVTVTHEGDQP